MKCQSHILRQSPLDATESRPTRAEPTDDEWERAREIAELFAEEQDRASVGATWN